MRSAWVAAVVGLTACSSTPSFIEVSGHTDKGAIATGHLGATVLRGKSAVDTVTVPVLSITAQTRGPAPLDSMRIEIIEDQVSLGGYAPNETTGPVLFYFVNAFIEPLSMRYELRPVATGVVNITSFGADGWKGTLSGLVSDDGTYVVDSGSFEAPAPAK